MKMKFLRRFSLGIQTSKVLKKGLTFVSPMIKYNTSSVIDLSLMSCSSAELISVSIDKHKNNKSVNEF
jgi:hypothetical protein